MKSWRRRTVQAAGTVGGPSSSWWKATVRHFLLFGLSRRGIVTIVLMWCTLLIWALRRQQTPGPMVPPQFAFQEANFQRGLANEKNNHHDAKSYDRWSGTAINLHVWVVAFPTIAASHDDGDGHTDLAAAAASRVVRGAHLLAEALSAPVRFPLEPVNVSVLCCCRGTRPPQGLPSATTTGGRVLCVESLAQDEARNAPQQELLQLCGSSKQSAPRSQPSSRRWRTVVRRLVGVAETASHPVRDGEDATAVSKANTSGGGAVPSLSTTREPTVVMMSDTVLADLSISSLSITEGAATAAMDGRRPEGASSRFLTDVMGLIRQSMTFGGITTARWLVAQQRRDKDDDAADGAAQNNARDYYRSRPSTPFSILLDGLRIVRGPPRVDSVGGVVGREVAVEPRFHGYDASYEGHAEGSYVSPLHARQAYLAGSARDGWYRQQGAPPATSVGLRTIDVPDGSFWAAPLSMVLGGMNSLLARERHDDRTIIDWGDSADDEDDLCSAMVAMHTMSSCRRRSAQPSCTLFLSHNVHLLSVDRRPLETNRRLAARVAALLKVATERWWVSPLGAAVGGSTPVASSVVRLRHAAASALEHRIPVVRSNSHRLAGDAGEEGGDDTGRAQRQDLELLTQNTTLYWDPFCSCTGINVEAINFLVPLERELPVQAVASSDCWCSGFPPSDAATLSRIRQTNAIKWQGSSSSDVVTVADRRYSIWVSHKPVDFFPTFPYHGAMTFPTRPSYVVGRAMTESDRFSDTAIRIMNDDARIDELWVPSPFLVDVLYASGLKQSRRVVVVPEAIDAAFYDPQRFDSNNEDDAQQHGDQRQQHPEQRRFRFLSNFKWEPRKGWDLLLEAYFTTFNASDPVELVLKTYLYMDPSPRDVHRIQQRILAFVNVLFPPPPVDANNGVHGNLLDRTAKKTWQWVVEHLPKVTIVAAEIPAHAMPAFYAAHDAFVLPTRGEGWGLPFQEAMSMGLPCVATAWSGMLGFMHRNNSLLVDVLGTEAAVDQPDRFHQHIQRRLLHRQQRGEQQHGTAAEPLRSLEPHCVFDKVPPGGTTTMADDDGDGLLWLRQAAHGVVVDQSLANTLRWCADGDAAGQRRQRVGHWAIPDVSHVGALMRHLYEHPDEGRNIGTRGRVDVARYYSREAVAGVVTKRLLAIIRQLRTEQ